MFLEHTHDESLEELGKEIVTSKNKKRKRYYKSPYQFYYNLEWSEEEAMTWCHFVNYKHAGDRKKAVEQMHKYAKRY